MIFACLVLNLYLTYIHISILQVSIYSFDFTWFGILCIYGSDWSEVVLGVPWLEKRWVSGRRDRCVVEVIVVLGVNRVAEVVGVVDAARVVGVVWVAGEVGLVEVVGVVEEVVAVEVAVVGDVTWVDEVVGVVLVAVVVELT